jgi:hypothetical protein
MSTLTPFQHFLKRRFTRLATSSITSSIGRCKVYRAEFVSGGQSFVFQSYEGTKADGEWYRREFAIALSNAHEIIQGQLRFQRIIRASRGKKSKTRSS